MFRFVFYYYGLLKREISAYSFDEAVEKLIALGPLFGIDPEDYEDYEIL